MYEFSPARLRGGDAESSPHHAVTDGRRNTRAHANSAPAGLLRPASTACGQWPRRARGPMGALAARTPELEEADREDDLPLGGLGQAVPQSLRRDAARRLGERLPRELDVVRMHNVAHEARHRHAAVLDLRLAQEADRGRVAVAPELAAAEVERIPVADDRVELRTRTWEGR